MTRLTKQKRDQLILVGIGTVILCVAIYFLAVAPGMESLEEMAKGSTELIGKINAAEKDAKDAPLLAARFVATSNLLHEIEAPMATGDIYSWIIQTMIDFRELHKEININQVSKETLGEVDMFPKFPYKAARFTVKGVGRYADIGKFIADFENRYPFFKIQNLDITPEARNLGEDAEKLDFTLEIMALVKPSLQ
jgi:hypothetical protein